jgi:hypothetical protein
MARDFEKCNWEILEWQAASISLLIPRFFPLPLAAPEFQNPYPVKPSRLIIRNLKLF